MFPPLSRVVVLESKTNCVIKIMEWRHCAPHGSYSYEIKLCSYVRKEITARMFHQRAIDAWRPTVLKIFVDNVKTTVTLTPQHFIEYAKITFEVDDNGKLIVKGVKAKPIELRRLSGMGFLLGRTYEGRREELIT